MMCSFSVTSGTDCVVDMAAAEMADAGVGTPNTAGLADLGDEARVAGLMNDALLTGAGFLGVFGDPSCHTTAATLDEGYAKSYGSPLDAMLDAEDERRALEKKIDELNKKVDELERDKIHAAALLKMQSNVFEQTTARVIDAAVKTNKSAFLTDAVQAMCAMFYQHPEFVKQYLGHNPMGAVLEAGPLITHALPAAAFMAHCFMCLGERLMVKNPEIAAMFKATAPEDQVQYILGEMLNRVDPVESKPKPKSRQPKSRQSKPKPKPNPRSKSKRPATKASAAIKGTISSPGELPGRKSAAPAKRGDVNPEVLPLHGVYW